VIPHLLRPFFTFKATDFHIGGNPATVAESVRAYTTFGTHALHASAAMASTSDGGFEGSEGERYKELINAQFPNHLRVTGESHTAVGKALGIYEQALIKALAEMESLTPIAGAQHAATQTAYWDWVAAKGNATRAALTAAAATTTAAATIAVPGVNAATASTAATAQADAAAAEAAAEAALAHWEAMFVAWTGHCETAASIKAKLGVETDTAVAGIHAAERATFADNSNLLEKIWGKVEDFVDDHKQLLSIISDVLQVVGGIMLFIPGLNILGGVLLGIGVGLKGLLAATGNASWGEFLFDLATAGPLGMIGKAAKLGKLGNTAMKAADGMSRVKGVAASVVKSGANKTALKTADAMAKVGGARGETLAKNAYRKVTRGGEICFAAEPVDMATGNMVDFITDIRIDGVLPLTIDRNANTNHELGRALGPRWVSTMDTRLEVLADEALMVSGDGALLTFPAAPEDGSEVRADGRPWLLSFADGSYRVRDVARGLTYFFNTSGSQSMISAVDSSNAAGADETTCPAMEDVSPSANGAHTGSGVRTGSLADAYGLGFEIGLSAVVHHSGHRVDYHWDVATGCVSSMVRSDGTTLEFSWDEVVGRVASVWVSNRRTHPDQAPLRLISYEYDAHGNLVRVVNSHAGVLQYHYDQQSRPVAWTDRNGASYYYRFDDHGRVTSQVGTGGMFPNIMYWGEDTGADAPTGGRVCVLIETAGKFAGDPLTIGDAIVDEYHDRLESLPLYRTLVDGGLEAAGLTGRGRAGARDESQWQVPAEWLVDEVLGDIRPTVYRSTVSGDVWRIITPEGAVEDREFNDYHQVTRRIDSAGAVTQTVFDDNALPVETVFADGTSTRVEPGAWGVPVRVVGRDGLVTEYEVDAFGMTRAVTTADGATTSYDFDYRPSGIVPSGMTSPDGLTTSVECDDAGRTVAVTDAAGRRTSHVMDVRGLVTESMDADGNVTTIDYTPEGWPTRLTHPDGSAITAVYDGEGNQLSTTNEVGATTSTAYTVFDKPVATTDAMGATTRITYNTQMQPVAVTNADGFTWSYEYDLDGAVVRQVDYNGIVTTSSTSADGLVSTVTTPAGTTTTTRNLLGLTTCIEDASGATVFDYDTAGRVLGVVNPSVAVTFVRDECGRAVRETTRLVSGEATSHSIDVDSVGVVTAEHVSVPAAGVFSTEYVRNGVGEITGSTISHSGGGAGSAASIGAGGVVAEIGFSTDSRGGRSAVTMDGLVRRFTCDDRGRITGDRTDLLDSSAAGGAVAVAGREFVWRADDTLVGISDQLRGTTEFVVDAVGRATGVARSVSGDGAAGGGIPGGQAVGSGVSVVGSPDVVGGVDGRSGVLGREEYGFSPAGVLASTDDGVVEFHRRLPTRVGRTSFVYDAAGRVVQTVTKRLGKKPLVHRFYYATGQQPVGFCSSDAPEVGYRYVYDGLGRRVAKEVVDTATGQVVCREVFAHTGNQLAAVVTTVDTGDPGRVGCGLVWSVDPTTGEVIGQITVAAGDGVGVTTPAAGAAGGGRCGDGVTGDGGYLEARFGQDDPGRGLDTLGVADTAAGAGSPGGAVVSGWSQAQVDARFYALVADLAGAPQEIIDPATGQVEGRVAQSLYGKRTWAGGVSSPLLFAGQYEDVESGWVYNRFRFYQPLLGSYNAQDPLGLAPRVASGQGYVDHAAFWVDVLGLKSHEVSLDELKAAGVPAKDRSAVQAWLNGRNTDAYVYSYMDKTGNQMQYIGMTNDPLARAGQHGSRFGTDMERAKMDPTKLSSGADSLTRRQARSFEELGIDTLHMQKDGGQLLNARHEVSPKGVAPTHVRQGALLWAQHMVDTGAVKVIGL